MVYPYDFMDSFEKFNQTALKSFEKFNQTAPCHYFTNDGKSCLLGQRMDAQIEALPA